MSFAQLSDIRPVLLLEQFGK
ncbi:hypothetical protein CVT24_002735 [Panaeolus cyanescens]|uniref:Uncharacterized protein n=1 Tax=Panaeolus cyanescens TaxID=181874 RepID=A0A409XC36_9AGAR|nr:hypothetical protein CVT24_002735 [Panaeolus cyanescens]